MPTPPLRVSPSGPLADGGTNPLFEIAGTVYKNNDAGPYAGFLGPAEFSNSNDLRLVYYRQDGAAPASETTQVIPLAPLVPGFSCGLGVWEVEAVISCGFNTSLPLSVGETGALDVTFAWLSDSGAQIGSPGFLSFTSSIPRGVINTQGLDDDDFGLVHSTVLRAVMTVDDGVLASNGGLPIGGLKMALTRVSTTGLIGNYSTGSGWLEFTRDVSFKISRLR